jgi:Fe-S oxidoreductase
LLILLLCVPNFPTSLRTALMGIFYDIFLGCSSRIYPQKPVNVVLSYELNLFPISDQVLAIMNMEFTHVYLHTICCRHDPKLPTGTRIINTCAGCDKRFGSLYKGLTTVSLWEVLANSNSFQFPDYHGLEMTIHDACPVRTNSRVHDAIRTLLQKMNIKIIEAPLNRSESQCCGDSGYPSLASELIVSQMKKRANTMPCPDVCVYCVSCIKSMHIGGKQPRYILDLLFQEPTEPQIYDTAKSK